jgi:hypothetical protein
MEMDISGLYSKAALKGAVSGKRRDWAGVRDLKEHVIILPGENLVSLHDFAEVF